MEKLALGMVETKGLIGAIEAADAMVKARVGDLYGTHVIPNPHNMVEGILPKID